MTVSVVGRPPRIRLNHCFRLRRSACRILVLIGSLIVSGGATAQQPESGGRAATGPRPTQAFGQTVPVSTPTSSRPGGGALPANNTAAFLPIGAVNATSTDTSADSMLSPDGVRSTLKVLLAVTVFSLAPSLLIMTTCFVRFIVVLGLLKQALGAPQLAPSQVTVSLSLFLTLLVMTPVWTRSYEEGVKPYTSPEPGHAIPSLDVTLERTLRPVRGYMAEQIEAAGNSDAVWTFLQFQRPDLDLSDKDSHRTPRTYDEIPLSVLLPAFVISELKAAFIIGFQLFLPFLVIDLVVSSVLVSMGMLMLPPAMVSLPLKLLLFVLIDGWSLTAEMLIRSVSGTA